MIKNKVNGKVYIGQSINSFYYRYSHGIWWKQRINTYLKRAVNKYGLENFEICIIKNGIHNRKRLNKLEKYYEKKFRALAPNGYNLKECGGVKGRLSKTRKEQIGKRSSKTYNLLFHGKDIAIKNMKRFCRKRKLGYNAMLVLVNGSKLGSYKGYTYPQTKFEYKIRKTFKFISPSGETIRLNNLRKFCALNNLNYILMQNVHSGKILGYKGWVKYFRKCALKQEQNKILIKSSRAAYKIFFPDKRIEVRRYLADFYREHKTTYWKVRDKIKKYGDFNGIKIEKIK